MSLLNDASLVFIPSGYKEDKVYSVIPSNGAGDLDFVRGCDATRVNPQSLVENTPWNVWTNSNNFSATDWVQYQLAPSTGTTTDIYGNSATVYKLIGNITNSYSFINRHVSSSNHTVFSVYAKPYGYTKIGISNRSGGAWNFIVDLSTEVVSNIYDSSSTILNINVVNVGGGWKRIEVVVSTAVQYNLHPLPSNFNSTDFNTVTLNGTDGVWVMGAQVNTGSTAKPYFPTTDRLNVPRLTYSPTLIERQSTNLALYSQEFDNSWWNKYQATISANTNVAPDGTSTADSITSDIGSTGVLYTGNLFTAGQTATLSIYAKSNTSNIIRLGTTDNAIDYIANFNLSTGTIVSQSGVTASIQDVGNGWYRCSILRTMVGNANFFVLEATGSLSLYIWGAQLETGSLTSYIPTTSTAVTRVASYNSGCPSLLLEKQSTNLALYSEEFDNATWSKGFFNTISANATVSPDGTTNADKIQSSATGNQFRYATQLITPATVTYSIYAKAGEVTEMLMFFSGANGIIWNLTNGSFISYYSSGASTISSYSSQSVGNGWYRYTMTSNTPVSSIEVYMSVNSVLNSSIPVGNGFYLWGAQAEASSYPTSYIPTTSATVTRLADSCSKTGISSLIGQTEGVIFIDAYRTQKSVNYQALIGLGNGASSSEMIEFYYNSSNVLTIGIYNSGQQFVSNTVIANGRHKIALAYKANDFAVYIDGVLIATDNSGSVPTMNKLQIGDFSYTAGYAYDDTINQVLLFKRRLTNTELANLTTL